MRRVNKKVWWVVGTISSLYVLFVNPTPFRYSHSSDGETEREFRLTGNKMYSSPQGWITEAEKDRRFEEKRRNLALGRKLPTFKIGMKGEYTVQCKIAFIRGELQYKAFLSPYGQKLKAFCESTQTEKPISIEFLNEGGWTLLKSEPSHFSSLAPGNGKIEGIVLEGSHKMSEEDYNSIVAAISSWRF